MDVAPSVHFVGEVTGLHVNPIMMLLLCEGLETKGSSFRTGSTVKCVTVAETETHTDGSCSGSHTGTNTSVSDMVSVVSVNSFYFSQQFSDGQAVKQLMDGDVEEAANFGVSLIEWYFILCNDRSRDV